LQLRSRKLLSCAALWAIWLVLVFGVLNIYGPSLWSYRPEGRQGTMTEREIAEAMTPLQTLGVILRNDTDTGRYLSYANAILGRPYGAYYVRPMHQWTTAERKDAGSNPTAMVSPDHPLLPWRDFSVEYPPGMLLSALAPALFTADKDLYHLLFSVEMGLMLTLAVWLSVSTAERVAPGLGRETLLMSILFVGGLGIIGLRRYDAAVALAVAAVIAALSSRKAFASGLALAAGVIVKGVPILLAPIGLAWFAAQRAWGPLARSLAGAAALLFMAAAFYLSLAGANALDAIVYHGERPLQIESSYGAMLIAARAFDPDIVTNVFSFGSENIVSVWESALRRAAGALPVFALLGVYFWCWSAMRRAAADPERLHIVFASASAAFVAFITLGKICSPQYLVWLLPTGVIAAALGSRLNRILLISACVLSQIEYPFAYLFLAPGLEPSFGLLVLVRNGVLIWWAVLAMREAGRPALSSPPNAVAVPGQRAA
jgi:hypothetical protein